MGFPLSGFTAFPNPYMIPFMGMQSWVIGIMFGMAYQGGKRLISKMPNEEFNALDLNKFGFDQMHKILSRVPEMETMFAEMRPMVEIMIKELEPLLKTLGEATAKYGAQTVEAGIDVIEESLVATANGINKKLKKAGLTWTVQNLKKIGVAQFLIGSLIAQGYLTKEELLENIPTGTTTTSTETIETSPSKHITTTDKIGKNHPDAIRVKNAFNQNKNLYEKLTKKWVPLKQQALIALGKALQRELKGRTFAEHLRIFRSKKGNIMAQVIQKQIVDALSDLKLWANQKVQIISTNTFLRKSYLKMTGIDLGKL